MFSFFIASLFFMSHSVELQPLVKLHSYQGSSLEGVVYLKDIATIEKSDSLLQKQLQNLVVSLSPMEWQNFSRHQKLQTLNEQIAPLEQECQCHIRFLFVNEEKEFTADDKNVFSLDKAKDSIYQRLLANCPSCQFQLSLPTVLRGQVPEKYSQWTLQEDLERLRGSAMIRVYFDNKTLDPLILQTWIQVKQPVLITKQAHTKGSRLTEVDVESQMIDMTQDSRLFASREDLAGKELKRTIGKSQFVTLDDLVDRQSVKLGESVVVEVQTGAMALEMTGVALKSGKIGDRVPVRVTKTQKQLTATVVGESRLRF